MTIDCVHLREQLRRKDSGIEILIQARQKNAIHLILSDSDVIMI